jgi:hypothetical protein
MDLLSEASKITTLTKKPNLLEYAGKCPKCGGSDRFVVNTSKKKPQKDFFLCRRCRPRKGDLIDFIQWRDNVGYLEAKALTNNDSYLPGNIQPLKTVEKPIRCDDTQKAVYIYHRSKVDYRQINAYFKTRGLLLPHALIDALELRFNEHKDQRAVVVPIRTPQGKLVQIQRIILNEDYTKQDKRLTGRFSGDRGLLLRRNPNKILILEGLEDLLAVALHSKCNASLLCSFGVAGFTKLKSFTDQFKRAACLLDNDSNGAGVRAASRLPPNVVRLLPGMVGVDANKALIQGRFKEWVKSVKPYE